MLLQKCFIVNNIFNDNKKKVIECDISFVSNKNFIILRVNIFYFPVFELFLFKIPGFSRLFLPKLSTSRLSRIYGNQSFMFYTK